MKLSRSAVGWGVAALLIANGTIGAPAQVANARQQWSVTGIRVVSPAVEFQAAAGGRLRLTIVSTRDEIIEVEAAAFSTEPTATGLAVRARRSLISGTGARVALRDATFEMTLSRDGVVSVWASGEAAK